MVADLDRQEPQKTLLRAFASAKNNEHARLYEVMIEVYKILVSEINLQAGRLRI